tara:strand:- start:953 stop:1978 length:1026 start_codon:yes stop_codon:yes gene_type:complete
VKHYFIKLNLNIFAYKTSMSITIKQYTNTLQDDWDNFINSSISNTSLFFLRKFLSYHGDHKFNDYSLLIYNKSELVSVIPAAVNSKGLLLSHPGLSHGSFATQKGLGLKEILQIISAVQIYIENEALLGIEINTQPAIYSLHQSMYIDFTLDKLGFKRVCSDLTNYIYTDSPQLIYSRFNESCKRAIRKATKLELSFNISDQFIEFYKILKSNLLQRHNVLPAHTLKELCLLKSLFPESINLFSISNKKQMIAGTIAFRINDFSQLLFYIAHDPQFQDMRPVNLLLSKVAYWCAENGYKILDFGKFTLNGEPNLSLARFKEGFGSTGAFRNKYSWIVNNEK